MEFRLIVQNCGNNASLWNDSTICWIQYDTEVLSAFNLKKMKLFSSLLARCLRSAVTVQKVQLVSLNLLFSGQKTCNHTKTIYVKVIQYTAHTYRLAAWICFVNISPFGFVVERSKNKYEQRLEPWTNKFRCKRKVLYAKITQWLFSPFVWTFYVWEPFVPYGCAMNIYRPWHDFLTVCNKCDCSNI